jgi:hypothetical protein
VVDGALDEEIVDDSVVACDEDGIDVVTVVGVVKTDVGVVETVVGVVGTVVGVVETVDGVV